MWTLKETFSFGMACSTISRLPVKKLADHIYMTFSFFTKIFIRPKISCKPYIDILTSMKCHDLF